MLAIVLAAQNAGFGPDGDPSRPVGIGHDCAHLGGRSELAVEPLPAAGVPHAKKAGAAEAAVIGDGRFCSARSEEHTSELQSRPHLVCRLLLEKKKKPCGYISLTKRLLNYVRTRR